MVCCHRIGCDQAGTHALKIIVPSASGMRPTAAEGLLGIVLCEEHFEEAELEMEFIHQPAIQMLFNRVIDDGVQPAWWDAYLEAVSLDSEEYRAWRAMEVRAH